MKIVRKEQIELLPTSLADMTRVLSDWGFGVRELLGETKDSDGLNHSGNETPKP